MHRVQPKTQNGYLLVAHTAFSKGSKERGFLDPVKLRRTKAKFLYGATIDVDYSFEEDPTTLKGMKATLTELSDVSVPQNSDNEGSYAEIVVPERFPPGSIMLFETEMVDLDATLEAFCLQGATDAFSSLDLIDLNVVLHRSDGEERDSTGGDVGAYDVPGLGKLVYCGLEGWMHPLRHIMRINDLGHPLCAHLRNGAWPFDYVSSRLTK
jgi:glycogen debranching enzyme